jgi:prepilin-type N-terminal cleavage/methylation domain-containing protein
LTADRRPAPDRGFTLIEVMVVVAVLGMVMTALAAAFVVIVKSTPTTEARTDDARALDSLTTWLSKDVASTSEDGFVVGATGSGCTGVPASKGLLELRWSEGSTTYVSNYRYLSTGATTGSIHRYTCLLNQPASDLKLTPDLANVASGTLAPAPVAITLVSTTMANGNPGNKGLQFVVTVLDESGVQRELLSLDATTSNVVTTLPPTGGPPGPTNTAPTAPNGATSITAGQSGTYPLPASDPQGDALTTTVTGPTPVPTAGVLTVTPPSPPGTTGTTVTITADINVPAGLYSFGYTVTDTGGLSASGTLSLTVNAPSSNQPPVATAASTLATRGVMVVVPLTVSDPEDGSNVTVVVTPLTGWTINVSGANVSITPPATAANSTVLTYTVTDTGGATATSTITVQVCTVTIQSISENPVNVYTSGTHSGELKKDPIVTISTNGACSALVLGFKPKAADAVESTEAFGAGTSVTIVGSKYVWDIANRDVALNVRQGSNGVVVATQALQVRT